MRLYLCLALFMASSMAAVRPGRSTGRIVQPYEVVPEQKVEWEFELDELPEVEDATGGVCDTNSTGDRCPFPYKAVLTECFYASKLELKWEDARQYCRRMGGDLASPSFMTAVQAYLRDIKFDNYAYLGGKLHGDKTWKYVDGSSFNTEDWGNGQPNTWGEDCLVLYYSEAPGTVHDYKCDGERPFICEYQP